MLVTLLLAFAPLAPGEPFADLDHDAAIEKAAKEQKLCLIDFTATWCGPCKKMEQDTWADAGVREWLAANAIAIQIDTDEYEDLAHRYEIRGIPAVIAVRDGKEFDRSVGYKDPARFLTWAKDVRAGKRASDELMERSKAVRESDDVEARYKLAQELQQARMYDEALAHYLWVWPASRNHTGYGGVRLSFMLSNMAQLAQQHAPAKEAFAKILDELQRRVDETEVPSFEDWQEWTAFCEHFGGRPRVVAWYEKRRDEQGRLFASAGDATDRRVEHQRSVILDEVFDVLMEEGRPLDAVRLYDDTQTRAEQIVGNYRMMKSANASMDEEMRADIERFQREKLVKDLSRLYAVLLAADRRPEAGDVAATLLATLDTPESRVGLVRAALDVGKTDEALARWLDEAEKAGTNVRLQRKKLEKLQAKQPPEPDPGD
jgi:thioredoxin-related protein